MADEGGGKASVPEYQDALLREIARAPPRSMSIALGDPLQIGHFKIASRLGSGGMGVVFRAYDELLRREVALKLLPVMSAADPECRQRFLREGRLAGLLLHPNVAVVHEVGEADGYVYIAMERVQGVTLRQRLDPAGLPHEVALELALQTARGLAAAHAKGIVHRDLKPENVMVSTAGVVKLLDFGLAKGGLADTESALGYADTESQITREGVVLGSSAYMSPEQALGMKVDARSDVFSFGIVLYEMLTGRRPFVGKTLGEIRAAIARELPNPIGDAADVALANVAMRCLKKQPDARYGDARAVAQAIAVLPRAKENPLVSSESDRGDRSLPRERRGLVRRSEEEICPLPAPLAELPLVKEVKGTVIVASLRGLRDGGYVDAYMRNLDARQREAVSLVVPGEWIPMELALVHYRACQALGLPSTEIVRMGRLMARRPNSNVVATVAKIAKTSGVTPWVALKQLQRLFESNFRGGGGTRVVKLGPKEARIELVAFPLVGIPWCRDGWRGTIPENMEAFCERCYATEVGATATSLALRIAWV